MSDWHSFDGVAEVYERVQAPRLASPARDLVALAGPPPGGRVLDVGTGTGVAAQAAAEALGPGGLAIGADVSLGMLTVARRVRPAIPLVAATAIDLPFRNGTFDAVTANFVLAHFTNFKTALADMIRVLRSGGRLAVSAWSDSRDDLSDAWNEMLESVVPREMLESMRKEASPGSERFRDREKLEDALRDAELNHVRTEPREYRFTYSLDDYVAGMEVWASARFVHEMLGEDGWRSFHANVRKVFGERFSDPLNDFRYVLLGVGTRP